MINKKYFWDNFPFRPVSEKQVEAINFIIDSFDKDDSMTSLRWLAYILATCKHETAETYLPIREYGKGRGRPYGKPDSDTGQTYYGRGYVQLTWKFNYQKATDKLGHDFVNNPDDVMKPEYAIQICFRGMLEGWFTNRSLVDYFNEVNTDWYNARKIINGLDCASLIAGYAQKFYEALKFDEVEQATAIGGVDIDNPDGKPATEV